MTDESKAAVPSYEELASLCECLASILRTPEPGLASWCAARNRIAGDLYKALNNTLPDERR